MNCYADGACDQLPRPAIKAYKVSYCTRAATQLVFHVITSAEEGGNFSLFAGLFVCMSVCLSVDNINQKVVDRFS